jgi:hypothetical protein
MLRRALSSVFLLAAIACSSNVTPTPPASPTPPAPVPAPSVSSVIVSGTAPTVGATAPFSATANLSNGTAQTITSQATWSSSNTLVATVTNAGLVTGVGVGIADITATYQGASGTAHTSVIRATYAVSGLVTDGTSGGVLPNINVQIVDSASAAKSTLTDGAGNYSMSGISAGPATLTASAVSYQTTTRTIEVSPDTRVDIVLARTPPPAPVGYAGIWTGLYLITDCQDIDGPGLTPLNLCGGLVRTQGYRFTLSQSGTSVTGTYKLISPFYTCPCGGDYGTFDMSGAVASDGSLVVVATGVPRATGLVGSMTFTLKMPTSSTLTGNVTGELRFGGILRATVSGQIQSGTR